MKTVLTKSVVELIEIVHDGRQYATAVRAKVMAVRFTMLVHAGPEVYAMSRHELYRVEEIVEFNRNDLDYDL